MQSIKEITFRTTLAVAMLVAVLHCSTVKATKLRTRNQFSLDRERQHHQRANDDTLLDPNYDCMMATWDCRSELHQLHPGDDRITYLRQNGIQHHCRIYEEAYRCVYKDYQTGPCSNRKDAITYSQELLQRLDFQGFLCNQKATVIERNRDCLFSLDLQNDLLSCFNAHGFGYGPCETADSKACFAQLVRSNSEICNPEVEQLLGDIIDRFVIISPWCEAGMSRVPNKKRSVQQPLSFANHARKKPKEVRGVSTTCDTRRLQDCVRHLSETKRYIAAGALRYREYELDEACRRFNDVGVCVRRATRSCQSTDDSLKVIKKYWAGVQASFTYMCREGKSIYLKHQKCYAQLNLELALRRCNKTYKLDKGDLNEIAHTIKQIDTRQQLCRITNKLLQCLSGALEQHCGREAADWQLTAVKKLRQPNMYVYHGCTLE